MEARLNFFFDIDGTLLPSGRPVPDSAVMALEKAKAQGHRLFLCTGRSPSEVTDEVSRLPFDGGVYSAGASIVLNGKLIDQIQMTDEQKRLFAEVVERFGLYSINQSLGCSYMTYEGYEFYRSLGLNTNGKVITLNGLVLGDSLPWDVPLVKAYIMSKEGRVLEARRALEGPFHSVNNTTGFPETCAAELMLSGVDKASGILRLLKHLGDDISTTVGIGDGENDVEMIDVCKLGIAMGNSCDLLKQHANYVTTDIMDDGIANAMDYAMRTLA